MSRRRKEPNLQTYSGRLANRLRELRDQAGLSLRDMVQELNRRGLQLSLSGYVHWENGRRRPNLDAIPTIAEVLGLESIRELFPEK